MFDGGRLGYSAAIGKSNHSVQFAVMALQVFREPKAREDLQLDGTSG
jgi:hypothetical protein